VRDARRLGRRDMKIYYYYIIIITRKCVVCALRQWRAPRLIRRNNNNMIFIRLGIYYVYSKMYRADDERTLIIYRREWI